MDFALTEQQEMFRRSVREFLKTEYPMTLVRQLEEKQQGYSPEVYRKMAGMGWLGIMVPEDCGGLGGTWIDLAVFYEEAGRALLDSPHLDSVAVAAQAILALGTPEQKRRLLDGIVKGDTTISVATAEPDAGSSLPLMTTAAVPDGAGFVVNGTKLFVDGAHDSDFTLVAAKSGPPAPDGTVLLLVEKGAAGFSCHSLPTMAGKPLDTVLLQSVRVPRGNVLGRPGQGELVAGLIDRASILRCAGMVGAAAAVLDMTIDYAKQRVQFGQPIGAFQALQHKMARMSMALETARWLTYYVAWLQSQGLPCQKERAMANLNVGEKCRFISLEAEQVHGGMGIMQEHDLTFYFRRIKASQLNQGYQFDHQEAIAAALGL